MEAALGFEPRIKDLQSSAFPLGDAASLILTKWSGKRGLNPRPSPWQGDALPLSYFRKNKTVVPRPRIELGTRGFSVHCSTN